MQVSIDDLIMKAPFFQDNSNDINSQLKISGEVLG
jgi:hypothetical protein